MREVRNRYQIDAKTPLDVIVRCSDAAARRLPDADAVHRDRWPAWAGWSAARTTAKPQQSATHVHPEFESYRVAGGPDRRGRGDGPPGEAAGREVKHLQAARAKLGNGNFVDKAPAEVVQQQRDLVEDLQKQVQAIEENLRQLQGE